jgi:bifunctional DNA-binding transcriptional regulator/antitoxin component of YhaV-PrlF toxin-antitoxin module
VRKRWVLAVNERGQITIPKEALDHFGLGLQSQLKVEFLPGKICRLSAQSDDPKVVKIKNGEG